MSGKQEKAFRQSVQQQIEAHRAKREGAEENIFNVEPSRLHPVGDQVLVEIERETETEAGIIIPDSAQKGLPVAKVLAVGEKVTKYKEGELVIAFGVDARKIDTLLWLVAEEKIHCRVDPKPRLLIAQPA